MNNKKYVVVLGGCSIDKRIKIINGKKTKPKISSGGKAANQAVAISRAGIKTFIISRLSSKEAEKSNTLFIIKNLIKNKINIMRIEYDENINNDQSVNIQATRDKLNK